MNEIQIREVFNRLLDEQLEKVAYMNQLQLEVKVLRQVSQMLDELALLYTVNQSAKAREYVRNCYWKIQRLAHQPEPERQLQLHIYDKFLKEIHMSATVQFTEEKYKALKLAYAKAVEEGKDSFKLDGNEYVTAYAKYLLEYLSVQFEKG